MPVDCSFCQQKMTTGHGCTVATACILKSEAEEAETFDRLPFEDELASASCGDCNVSTGQFHHPGCDVERCPACGGQAISCECSWEGDEDDDDDVVDSGSSKFPQIGGVKTPAKPG